MIQNGYFIESTEDDGRTAVRTAVNTITAAQQQQQRLCMAAIGPRLKVFSLQINALWLCGDLCVFFFN
jgi:hypothetical protein